MELILSQTFTGENFLFAAICAVFGTIMLTRFKKLTLDGATVLMTVLKLLMLFVAYYSFWVIGLLIGRLFSDQWRAFMQFYLSAFGLALVGCCVFTDYKLKTRLIYLSLFVLTWWLLPALSFLLPKLIPVDMTIFGVFVGFSIPRILTMGLLVVILKKMDLDTLYVKSRWDIFLFEAVCLLCALVQIFATSHFDVTTNSYICLILWVMLIFVYCFYWFFLRESNQKRVNEIEMRVAHADLQYLGYLHSNYENIRMLKHELKNQFAYISMLYEEDREDEAKAFFGELARNAGKTLNFASSGNRTIDIAVSLTAEKTENSQVAFRQSLVVPENLPLEENDLFSLLINLLDNAYAGAMRSETDNRKVVIQICPNDCYLMIYVANTVSPDAGEEVLRSMERRSLKGDGHGYGHKIVKGIVKKYNGQIRYSISNGMFEAVVMLALTNEIGGKTV